MSYSACSMSMPAGGLNVDEMDRTQALEQFDRDVLIAEHRRRQTARQATQPNTSGLCIDCDEPIEPQRLRLLGECTERCASCAHDAERRDRGYAR